MIGPLVILSLCFFQALANPSGPSGSSGPPGPDCSRVLCQKPLCANPVTPPGKCCPSCDNSQCKFGGCVQFEPGNRVQWKPDPCTTCSCFQNQTVCAAIGCAGPPGPDPCFGRPLTSVGFRPSVCCPRCDFGVPEQACRAVPSKRRSFSLNHGGGTCTGSVIERQCDKIGFRKRGRKFRCVPVRRTRSVSLKGPNCSPFTKLLYKNVIYCRAVLDNSLTNAEGCDKIIR